MKILKKCECCGRDNLSHHVQKYCKRCGLFIKKLKQELAAYKYNLKSSQNTNKRYFLEIQRLRDKLGLPLINDFRSEYVQN